MSDSQVQVMEYYHNESDRFARRGGEVSAITSAFCAAAPVVGIALRNGPMIMLGFSFLAWLGVLLGVAAVASRWRPPWVRATGLIGLAINGAAAAFGICFVCVGGIC